MTPDFAPLLPFPGRVLTVGSMDSAGVLAIPLPARSHSGVALFPLV